MSQPSRYELVRTIATGGMAHVYEAVARGAQGFERKVAIKRILPEFAHIQAVRAMFLDEARIASRLHHGNIVQVLDYGLLEGSELLVMEYVHGLDASRALDMVARRGERFPEGLALHIVSEVAHALAYAHARSDEQGEPYGIVHRDVSPQNLLLSWDGDVKLSDFGIALASDRSSRTQTGLVKGKPDFMAPEQLKGETLSGAADVYALGATLLCLVGADEDGIGPVSQELQELIDASTTLLPEARISAQEVARRAGDLARRRLDRDGRGALQEWLAPLRSPEGAKVNALDDLMGMALVRTEGGRDFTVSKQLAAPPARERSDTPALPISPTSRWLGLGAVALVLLVGGGVALSRWLPSELSAQLEEAGRPSDAAKSGARASSTTPSSTTPSSTTPSSTTAGSGPTITPVEAVLVGTVTQEQSLGSRDPSEPDARPNGPDPGADHSVGGNREGRRPWHRTTGTRDPRAFSTRMTTTVDAPMAGSREGRGWLRVPRRSERQERIFIDGAPRGFTPFSASLPAGSHRIRIVDAESGATLAERSVQLRPHHTRTAPLRIAP